MKKLIFVVVAVVLCMAFAVGCAAPAAAPSESAPAAESAQPTASAEASEDAPAAGADYMSWTSEEWSAASDGEKTAASEALLLDIGDYMMDGYSDLLEQAKTNDSVKEQIDSQVESLKTQIGTFLESSSGVTIGDLAEASKQVADGGAE